MIRKSLVFEGWTLTVSDINLSAGAGFLVAARQYDVDARFAC